MLADFFVSMDEAQLPHPTYPQALIDIYTLPQTYRQIILTDELKVERDSVLGYAQKCFENYELEISKDPKNIYDSFVYVAIHRNMFLIKNEMWLDHMAKLFTRLDLDDRMDAFCELLDINLIADFRKISQEERENINQEKLALQAYARPSGDVNPQATTSSKSSRFCTIS